MRNLSIASRMLLVAFLPALLVAVSMGLYSFVYSVRDGEIAEVQRAATLAEGLASAGEFAVATGNIQLLNEIAQPALSIPSIQIVRYFGPDGGMVYQSDNDTSLHGKTRGVLCY